MADQKENFQAKYIYIVEIDVRRGIDLISADVNGKSDPYVNVFCLDRKFKTIIQKKTLNPEWNAHTQYQFYQQPKEIKFIVKDWDKLGKPDPLGDYTLSLAGMFKDGAKPFDGCVTLDNVKNGQIDIKVECKRLAPFELLDKAKRLNNECEENKKTIAIKKANCANANDEYKKLQSEVPVAQAKYDEAKTEYDNCQREMDICGKTRNNYSSEYRTLEQECRDLKATKERMKAQYKEVKAELSRCKGDAGKAEERKHRYMDSYTGNVDEVRLGIYERIQKYGKQFDKGDDDSDQEYEIQISKDIVVGYAKKTREARAYQQEEDKEEDCERANKQASKYLEEIRRWNQSVNEELARASDRYLQDYDLQDSSDIEFFKSFFRALCKFFFNTQLVAATMEEFGDEIKKKTGKKASKCTFYDFWPQSRKNENATGGNDSDEDEEDYDDDGDDEQTRSLWNNIYTDLDFVMKELNTLLSEEEKKKPLKILCDNARDFMKVYYNGNYPRLSALVSNYTVQIAGEDEEVNIDHITDDALGVIVSLYADKKKFPEKLYNSIKNNSQKDDGSDDEDDDDDNKCADEDAFEAIIAQIVVCVATIIDRVSDLPTEDDRKRINEQRDCALTKASQLGIDADSCKLIERFFGYFFDPEGSGGCCTCDADQGGIMGFFGSIFGGMCK